MLFGLPIAGDAVAPDDVGVEWRAQMEARFQGVVRRPGVPAYEPLKVDQKHGPSKKWLSQFTVRSETLQIWGSFRPSCFICAIVKICHMGLFQAEFIHPDADQGDVSRHLEAYLLLLFGWVLFLTSHGDTVDRHLVQFAQQIADSAEWEVWLPICSVVAYLHYSL